MKYMLSRRVKTDVEANWKNSTEGELDYILTVLKLNLESPELQDREWRITPVDGTERLKTTVKRTDGVH
ncbi:hypothetical protein [Rossellomorea marisflavi]|uniref:hypothetical protein n=1 Tax=Rossellomorea marisflavi TaxID=189381 RepID=UPI003F9ED316